MQKLCQEERIPVHLWYLGNALLDFSVCCDNSVLEKYKLLADDNCEYSKDQEGLFEDLLNRPSVTVTPGGSAQNSARISRRLIPCPNSTVVFVGSLGRDSYGESLKTKVEQDGVITCYDYCSKTPTGTSACLVTEGNQRTLCARLGACTKFNGSFLKTPRAIELMEQAGLMYVEGYFLSHGYESVLEVADFAMDKRKLFAFNVSAVYIATNFSIQISNLLPKVDILFGNGKEVIALARWFDDSVCSIDKAVQILSELPKQNNDLERIIVATDGPNSVVCCQGESKVVRYPVEPVNNVEDTIGAGDAFVGAFLAVWCFSRNLNNSVLCGIEAARLVIQSKGCVLPEVIPSSLLKFL